MCCVQTVDTHRNATRCGVKKKKNHLPCKGKVHRHPKRTVTKKKKGYADGSPTGKREFKQRSYIFTRTSLHESKGKTWCPFSTKLEHTTINKQENRANANQQPINRAPINAPRRHLFEKRITCVFHWLEVESRGPSPHHPKQGGENLLEGLCGAPKQCSNNGECKNRSKLESRGLARSTHPPRSFRTFHTASKI